MTSSLAQRAARSAMALATLAVMTASAAPAAEVPPPTPLQVGGPKIALATDPAQAPLVDVGLHQATIPARSGRYTFRVRREASERLTVGLSTSYAAKRWQGIGSATDSFDYEYKTVGGQSCSTPSPVAIPQDIATGSVYSSLSINPQPTHLGDDTDANSAACRSATEFVLTVIRTTSGADVPDAPTEISVVRMPAVTGGSSKASVNGLAGMSTSALDPTSQVAPGTGWMDARTVTPGGYLLNAVPGRAMVFRVHLGWGQRMSVGWQLPQPGKKLATTQPMRATIRLYSPTLSGAELTDTKGQNEHVFGAGSSDPVDLGAYTAPIEDGNSDLDLAGDQKAIWWQTMPGWYYVVAGLGPDPKDARSHGFHESASVPTTLSVRVEGQAQPGPTMALAQPPAGSLSGRSTGSKVAAGVWVSVAGAGALLIAGTALALWRRSRSS